jgi:hypothetical protein
MVLHVLFDLGDQLYPIMEERIEQSFAQIALVAEQFAKDALCHTLNYLNVTVVHIAFAKVEGQQFPLFVDDQMELEPIEPTHGTFAALGQAFEDLVVMYPLVPAYLQCGTVNEIDPVAPAHAFLLKEKHERYGRLLLDLQETVIAYKLGEQRFIIPGYNLFIVMLECPMGAQMETDQYGDNLRITELGRPIPPFYQAIWDQFPGSCDPILIFLAKIINFYKDCRNFVLVHFWLVIVLIDW